MSSEKKVKKEPETKYEWTQYLIVPVMVEGAVDRITSVLVKRGYTVGPLSEKGTAYMSDDDNMVVLVTLILKKQLTKTEAKDENAARSYFMKDIKDVLLVTKTKYYMIWLGNVSMCTWALGNLKKSEAPEPSFGPFRSPPTSKDN
jgi:hypothetical protein